MKKKILWLVPAAVFLCTSFSARAQDLGVPDTVYFGDSGKAYGYPGGEFRVPVYIAADLMVAGLVMGMEFGIANPTMVYDSISFWGSIFMEGDYLELTNGLIPSTAGIDGTLPDVVGFGGAAINNQLPTGHYKLCDVFFHGVSFFDQVVVDSSGYPPMYDFLFASQSSQSYTPVFVTQSLTIEMAPPEIFIMTPLSFSVNAGSQLQFNVAVVGAFPPINIVLDSTVDVASDSALMTLPPVFGTNPITVVWTPTFFQDGIWIAYFTATDELGNFLPIEVTITVNFVPASCDVLRGDSNCDGTVSISDVVYVINYIFAGGPPPGCRK